MARRALPTKFAGGRIDNDEPQELTRRQAKIIKKFLKTGTIKQNDAVALIRARLAYVRKSGAVESNTLYLSEVGRQLYADRIRKSPPAVMESETLSDAGETVDRESA